MTSPYRDANTLRLLLLVGSPGERMKWHAENSNMVFSQHTDERILYDAASELEDRIDEALNDVRHRGGR